MLRRIISVVAMMLACPLCSMAQMASGLTSMVGKVGTMKLNVRDFGAKGDGETKDTAAFQKALDTCAVSGGGEVLVPKGKYVIGSIQIGNATVLRLEQDTILAGSPDLTDYPMCDVRWEGRWQPGRRGLVYASASDHIGIVGPGRIEGSSWGTNSPDGTRNPVVVEPVSCNDVLWDGFTVTTGGHWATHPTYCNNITIHNLNISGGRDGIDVDSCKDVMIDGCTINNGDDCISLKSGRGMDGARLSRPCENISIINCTLIGRTFACVGIGSETSGGVKNVRMEHCKMTSARSQAIYIKTRIGRAGGNENITGDDIDVEAQIFLRINLTSGGNSSTADDPVEGLAGYPFGKNIAFNNVRIKCTDAAVRATEVSEKKPMEGLTLTNISGTAAKGITIANTKGVKLSNINITGVTGAVLGTVNTTGTGLDGAEAIAAPVDPPPGNARGFGGGRGFGAGGGRRGRGPASAPAAAQ